MDISIPGSEQGLGKPFSAPSWNLLFDHVINPQFENGMENTSFKGSALGFLHENGCVKPFPSPEIVLQVEDTEW